MILDSKGPLPLWIKLLCTVGAKELVVGMRACAFIRVRGEKAGKRQDEPAIWMS